MAAIDPLDAHTLDGWTLEQIFAECNRLIETGARAFLDRPPDPKHGLVTKMTAQVISVSDDGVDVQVDTDPNGHAMHCSSVGSPNIGDRVVVFFDPSGGAVAVSGGTAQADTPTAPVQIEPATAYVPVTPGTLVKVAEGVTPAGGVLKGAWDFIDGGPWVVFSIEHLYGTNGTGVPTYQLPRLPVARRHMFSAYVVKQPVNQRIAMYAYSGFDGTTAVIGMDAASGGAINTPFSDAWPGSLNDGPSRLVVTGIYEAAT